MIAAVRPMELSQAFLTMAGPRDLAEIVRRLLQLEAERLNLPLGATQASLRVNVGDEGEDGVTLHVPADTETHLPAGDTLFQFKTTHDMKAILADVAGEVSKARPRAMLARGGRYVLVYSKDFVGRERDEVLARLKQSVSEQDRASVDVWGVGALEELCWDNPAIACELSLAPMQGVLPFSQWSRGVLSGAPHHFVRDVERAQIIEDIQDRIRTSQDVQLFNLIGDAGVGKTRLVHEALQAEDLRDQVLAGVSSGAIYELLNYLATRSRAHCVLVVDDVDPDTLDSLLRAAQLATGRVRLIAISLPPPRRWVRDGPWDIVLGPLETGAIEALLKDDLGLPEGDVRRIADVSEGYPRLAIEVARSYQHDQSVGDLTSAVERRNVNQLLERMIPDGESRKFLQVAAMFRTIGVDDDVRGELQAIAAAFDLDPVLMADVLRSDEGRFVSVAGRYRSVTPKLIAVWLATEAFRTYGSTIAQRIATLDTPLAEQFRDQLGLMADSPLAVEVVRDLLEAEVLREPRDFSPAVARFLQAAAAIVPKQVAQILQTAIDARDPTKLPRRELVWTLEQLLWPESTTEVALDLLLVLAEHETESFRNNATGVLTDSFQMHLGGTTTSYEQRLRWLERKLRELRDYPGRATLLAGVLCAGLRTHQVRMHGERQGRIGIHDWRPASQPEELSLRRRIWADLFDVLSTAPSDEHQTVAKMIASSVRQAATRGLLDEVLASLDRDDWAPNERAELGNALRAILRYDEPDDPYRAAIITRLEALTGRDFSERAQALFNARVWDLAEDRAAPFRPPAVIEDLVSAASEDPSLLTEAIRIAQTVRDGNTAYIFFRSWGLRNDPRHLATVALKQQPIARAAYQAALSAAEEKGDARWVDQQLTRAAKNPDLQESLVQLIQATSVTDTRARIALAARRAGVLPAVAFTQFLYGGPIRELSRSAALDIIATAAADGGSIGLEHALGMLDQYVEATETARESDVRSVALELCMRAAGTPELGPTGAYSLMRALAVFRFPARDALRVIARRLESSTSFAEPDELQALTDLLERAPRESTDALLRLLNRAVSPPYPAWAMWIEEIHVLNRAAAAGGLEHTWEWLAHHDETAQLFLLKHLNFGATAPDGLTQRLLESDPPEAIADQAAIEFHNALGIVSGPYHHGLERQLARARVWQQALASGPAAGWADELVEGLANEIPKQRAQDQERELRLR